MATPVLLSFASTKKLREQREKEKEDKLIGRILEAQGLANTDVSKSGGDMTSKLRALIEENKKLKEMIRNEIRQTQILKDEYNNGKRHREAIAGQFIQQHLKTNNDSKIDSNTMNAYFVEFAADLGETVQPRQVLGALKAHGVKHRPSNGTHWYRDLEYIK